MKISHIRLSVCSLLWSYHLPCPVSRRRHRLKAKATPSPSVEKEQQAGSESSKKETQQFVIRVKTKQKVDFSGTVTNVDPATATLSIRNQGKTISFDMSKAILMGYGSTGEIKKGDEVSVGYTQFGLQIRKGIFAVTHRESCSSSGSCSSKSLSPKLKQQNRNGALRYG